MKTKDITEAITVSKNHYAMFHTRLDEYLDQFLARYKESYYTQMQGRSTIYIPKTYSIIKRKVASFYDTFLQAEGLITIEGSESEVLNNTINHYENKDPYRSELISLFYDFYIYGIGIAKLQWFIDGVQVSRIDPRDIAFDVSAKSLRNCLYFVHSILVSRDTLESYGVKKPVPESVSSPFSRYKVDELYYFEKNQWWVASAHGGKVFSHRAIKRHPFAFGYAIPKMHDSRNRMNCVYGDSECRIVAPLQMELNEIRNQMRDATRLALDPKYLAEKGSGLDTYELYHSRPGDVIDVNTLKSLMVIPAPQLLPANNETKNIDLEMQEASGVTAYNSGISRAGMLNSTATGMSILSSEGNTKIASEIRTAYETFFKTFCNTYAKLVHEHAPLAVIRKANKGAVNSYDRSNYEFEAKIEIEKPGENTELKKQRLIEALQYIAPIDPQRAGILSEELLPMLVSNKTMKTIEETTPNA